MRHSFCLYILQREDWRTCLRGITFNMIYYFFEWQLAQKKNKKGHKKREIKSKKYLVTFWCNFRLVFEMTLHFKINKLVDCRLVSNVGRL